MTRSRTEQNALELWFQQVAEAMDELGVDMREVKIPIRPTKQNVKDFCKQLVAQHLDSEITSTTQWTGEHLDFVIDAMTRGLAERGISIPFPSQEEQLRKAQERFYAQ